jgi:hypothetical protein
LGRYRRISQFPTRRRGLPMCFGLVAFGRSSESGCNPYSSILPSRRPMRPFCFPTPSGPEASGSRRGPGFSRYPAIWRSSVRHWFPTRFVWAGSGSHSADGETSRRQMSRSPMRPCSGSTRSGQEAYGSCLGPCRSPWRRSSSRPTCRHQSDRRAERCPAVPATAPQDRPVVRFQGNRFHPRSEPRHRIRIT